MFTGDRKRNYFMGLYFIVILSCLFQFPAFPIYPDFTTKEFH